MDNRHWQYYNPNPYYHSHHHPHHHPHMNPHHRPVCCQTRAKYQEHFVFIYLFDFVIFFGYFYMCSEDLYQLSLNNRWIFTFFLFSSPKPWELIIFGVILCLYSIELHICERCMQLLFGFEKKVYL